MIILACAGSLPGYWTAVLTIDTFGRKPLQIVGFFLLTILFCVLGFKLHDMSEGTLLALYIIGQFLFNAGPNTTTFIVPGECFPTRYRSTGHGISAAMGKIGAIIAQGISIPLLQKDSPRLQGQRMLTVPGPLAAALCSLHAPGNLGVTLDSRDKGRHARRAVG
jgi:PHS family inorganic phosphate transporter-like MFS transporter